MKKALSIMVCYAVGMVALAFSANAAVRTLSSIDFHDPALWGKMPQYGMDDKGNFGTLEQKFWWCFGEGNSSVITNYEAGAERYDRFARYPGSPNPQPSYMMSGGDNTGYLDFMSESPLARTFNPVHADGSSDAATVPSADGLFVDTLVRFVPRVESADAVPTVDVAGKAKFICWLSAPDGAEVTNLIVTAGRYAEDGSITRVNYVVTNKVEAKRWYRLTARAIRNAATRESVTAPAFALYLDGEPVACAAEDYSIGENRAAMDDMFAGNALYSAHALFPPVRAFESTVPKMSGFAVQGCGQYDEFAVVNYGNPLAYEVDRIDFAVSLNTNAITNVICTVTAEDGSSPYFTTNSSYETEVVFKVAPGDRIHVDAVPTSAYSLASELTIGGNVNAVEDYSGYDVTMKSGEGFSDASRVTARINVGNAYFSVGGRIYESIEEAMEAANREKRTLVLENDVTFDPNFSVNGQMYVKPAYELVFDLHGCKVTGRNFRTEATIYDHGVLTIIDSVGGGEIIAPGTAIEVASTNDSLEVNYDIAALTLGSEQVRGDFKVTGRVRRTQGELAIMGGTYLTPWNLEPTNDFYLAEYIANERFGSECQPEIEVIAGRECHYWKVNYDGRVHVGFATEIGEVTPAWTNVMPGAKLVMPLLTGTEGYTTTNWYDTATGAPWNFAEDTVTASTTIKAQQRLDTYTITYDIAKITEPSSYTVKSYRRTLAIPEKDHYAFGGWRDEATGLYVSEVGVDARFVGTETIVTGNLELVAQWLPETFTWENTTSGNAESNGTYSGSWSFTIPVGSGFVKDSTVIIDEIAFAIVNPHLYPKTAECLEVTTADGEKVVSSARAYVVDEETKEYLVGDDWLKNGRPKVSYKFEGLAVKVAAVNSVRFCTAAGEPATGFLRLVPIVSDRNQVFGKCQEAGGDPASDDYKRFRPVYEVTGHPEEVSHE